MPSQVPTSIKFTEEKMVNATKKIKSILILKDATVHWEVITVYEGKVYKREWYCCLVSEILGISTKGKFIGEELEADLWKKVSEIDAMPTGSVGEQKLKKTKYGVLYNYVISMVS